MTKIFYLNLQFILTYRYNKIYSAVYTDQENIKSMTSPMNISIHYLTNLVYVKAIKTRLRLRQLNGYAKLYDLCFNTKFRTSPWILHDNGIFMFS